MPAPQPEVLFSLPDAPRILILKPSSLGDIVHGLPVLAAIRSSRPESRISWLVARAFAPFLQNHPAIDELIIFDRTRFGKMWFNPFATRDFLKFVRDLRRRRFDLIIDLQGLLRSGLLARLAGAGRRVGFADAREGGWLFYTHRVAPPPSAVHAVDRNLAVAAALGMRGAPPTFDLGITDAEMTAARSILGSVADAPFAAILPGARWSSKQWRKDGFASVIDHLENNERLRCIILGGPDDAPLAASIAAACTTRPSNLAGQTTLRELTAILSLAARVICVDSGPMHIAAALGRPITAIFGPTNPSRTGPYGETAQVVRLELPCSPCYRRTCPLGHHACMQDLAPQIVVTDAQAPRSHSRALEPVRENSPSIRT